jgi:hypothetical protein
MFLVAFEHGRHRSDLSLSESRNFLSHHSRSLGLGLCAALRYAPTAKPYDGLRLPAHSCGLSH